MSITIEEMNKQAELIAALRTQEAEAANVKKLIATELEAAENRMLEMLESEGLQKFQSPHGLVSISFRTSVKVPKTQEDREAMLAWFKEQGLDNLISVNSQSLNATYKNFLETAIEKGDSDFKIPGCNEVTMTPTLSFRR